MAIFDFTPTRFTFAFSNFDGTGKSLKKLKEDWMNAFGLLETSGISETETLPPTGAKQGLPRVARAGIVIGTAVVLLFLLWLFVCLMVKKSRRRRRSGSSTLPDLDMRQALLKAAI